jgi:hypothetical protein
MTEGGMNLWDTALHHVCAECFEDQALQAFIREKATARICDFCETEAADGVIAAPLDSVVRHIFLGVEREWTNADGTIPHDPETDQWLLERPISTEELLAQELELSLPRDAKGHLLAAIVGALPDLAWCRLDPLVPMPGEAIANSWRTFCHTIKYERRFFFLQHADRKLQRDIEQAEAAFTIPELLEEIAAYAARAGLFVRVPAGTEFIRCQLKPADEPPFSARRMGPPTKNSAVHPNRMSPSGISMFYGAEREETALAEIASQAGHFALGRFTITRELVLLDVRAAPALPSLFDLDRAVDRPFAMFMREFVADFQRPIARDRQPHIEYVPTQIVTEYFRTAANYDDAPIEGILYESTKPGRGTAVVLFADNYAVVENGPNQVDLDLDIDDRGHAGAWLVMTNYREVDYDPTLGILPSRGLES